MRFVSNRMGIRFAAAISLLAACSATRADFIGQQVHVEYDAPTLGSVYANAGTQNVTSGGVTFANISGIFDLTVGGSYITLDNFTRADTFTSHPFNGPVVSELSSGPTITGVTIDASSNLAGLTSSDVSFDANDVNLNLQGLSFDTNTHVTLDVSFAGSAVPLPSTAAGVTVGLLGAASLLALRRRRAPAL